MVLHQVSCQVKPLCHHLHLQFQVLDRHYVEMAGLGFQQSYVDAWVKTELTVGSKRVVGTFLSGNPGWDFSIRGNGKLIMFLNDGVESGLTSVSSNSVPNDVQFHHIAATVNRVTNVIKLYIDGMETNYDVDSAKLPGFSSGTDISSDTDFTMGARTDVLNPFKGEIDEVEIFG